MEAWAVNSPKPVQSWYLVSPNTPLTCNVMHIPCGPPPTHHLECRDVAAVSEEVVPKRDGKALAAMMA